MLRLGTATHQNPWNHGLHCMSSEVATEDRITKLKPKRWSWRSLRGLASHHEVLDAVLGDIARSFIQNLNTLADSPAIPSSVTFHDLL